MSVNHEAKLVENITNLMTKDSFNDVRIRLSNGVQVEANKIIIAAMSTFFNEKLQENVIKDQFLEIDLEILSTKEMLELVIKYLYTGKMDFETLSLKDLLDLMNLLKFLDLEVSSEVEKFTKEKIEAGDFSLEKLLILSSTAEAYKFDDIVNAIQAYLEENISDIPRLPEVKYLSCDTLDWLVQDYYEDYDNDHDIERFFSRFETLASWLESNEVKEKAKKTLLSYFDLERFTNNQLMSSVRKSKLFSESSILDVLSKSVTNLEDQIGKLTEEKQTCSSKLEKIEAENDALKKNINTLQTEKTNTIQNYNFVPKNQFVRNPKF